jgi:hypothetical protein
MMGKTTRRNSDDTPKNHRRERRRKLKTMNKEFTSSRYNNAEDYQDLSYLDEYSSYQRFDQRKDGRK